MKSIRLVITLGIFFPLFSCVSHNQAIDWAPIIEIVETKYDVRCDSIILLSKKDNNHLYFAVNLVEDSSNLSWWIYCSQLEDSIKYYTFFDFVNVAIEQCNNIESSISIIKQAMIDQDFQWQCTPIDSASFCSFYSRHAFALVVSNRKMQFLHSKNLVGNDYEAMPTSAMNGIIEAWQKTTYGFSSSFKIYLKREPVQTDSNMYLIRSEHQGKYAYSVLLNLDKKYFFSLEDICGQYSEDSNQSYSREAFSRFISVILSSSIPNSQKQRWIKTIVDLVNEYGATS